MRKNGFEPTMFVAAVLLSCSAATAQVATAEPGGGIAIEVLYKADVVAVVSGGLDRGVRLLGNAELMVDADLERLAGWHGARAKLHLLSVHGGVPNDLAGTVQGINNIEVAEDRTKLYEIWMEQSFLNERAALQLGMVDLNANFYQTDAAGLLIAPAFGIGSEIAATGPNGPSIFPSTALAARLTIRPSKRTYLHTALFNAKAGVLGDRGGVDLAMRQGALAIAEAGVTGGGKLALGMWRYTKRQSDIRTLGSDGEPVGRVAQGAYVLAEKRLVGTQDAARQLSAFARIGLSDADTSPFRGGVQAGLHLAGVVAGRPDSQLSFGVNQAYLSRKHRASARDEGVALGRTETGFELTYSDRILPFLTVQPDIQYIVNPSGDRAIRNAVVAGVRFTISAATK